jgi:predicted GH43/DUF377 family glycosyl hydrolase
MVTPKSFLLFFLLQLCCLFAARSSELNLDFAEALCDEAIVECKKVDIPGFPRAYNPSLIPYRDGYLLSFRIQDRWYYGLGKDSPRQNTSYIGVAKLGWDLKVEKGSVQILNIYSPEISSTAEDGRLLWIGDRIFLVYNDLPPKPAFGGFALYFAELIEKEGGFVLKERGKHLQYPFSTQVEKNWVPFVSEGKLFFIYSDFPRVVLEADLETGICREVDRSVSDWEWKWGVVRGGTPGCLIGDSYLTVFHSVLPVRANYGEEGNLEGRNYGMGAYLFEKEFPFRVKGFIPVPLGQLIDYTERNSSRVVFPGGLVTDKFSIHVAWGKNDREIYITSFNRKKLLDSISFISH